MESDKILTLNFDKLKLHVVNSRATIKNLLFKNIAKKPVEEIKYIPKDYILIQQQGGKSQQRNEKNETNGKEIA